MLQEAVTWMKGVMRRMLHMGQVKQALGVEIAASNEMQGAIGRWAAMFQNKAPWLDEETKSMNLSAAIAGEIARLATVELKSEISGSPRGDYLQQEYRPVLDALRVNAEYAAAGGGMAFKPCPNRGRITVDCVPAWQFFPTAFNGRKEVTGALFAEQMQRGRWYYTRLEHHNLTEQGYEIRNAAYRAADRHSLGEAVPLQSIPAWAELEETLTLRYRDGTAPEKTLFAYFKIPFANNIDPSSPVGVSAYSRAENLIRDADEQYSRILWEFEGSELAIDASEDALRPDQKGLPSKLPKRNKRLFRGLAVDQRNGGDLYEVFSPEIRDSALFHGLDRIMKRVEFNCYLSYGTLSDPQSVEKTAEEIKSSKQRSFTAIGDVQKALQTALEHLAWAMDFYASLYRLAPKGGYEISFTWGDGILEDTESEFLRRKALADDEYLKPEKLVAWYLGISEEEALREYMPRKPKTKLFPEE